LAYVWVLTEASAFSAGSQGCTPSAGILVGTNFFILENDIEAIYWPHISLRKGFYKIPF
jgi:hypothetical protein